MKTDGAAVWNKVKSPATVRARSHFCLWAVRELGFTNSAIAEKLGLTQPAVSMAVRRGETIAAGLPERDRHLVITGSRKTP